MGYSLTRMDFDTAYKMAASMVCTEWSHELSPKQVPTQKTLKKAVMAEISDHNPPRLYFTFEKGLFACFERKE